MLPVSVLLQDRDRRTLLTKVQGNESEGTVNIVSEMQYTDEPAMDWTLFDSPDWLLDFDNIAMPDTVFSA